MILEKKQSSKCIDNKENPYQLQVGDMLVEIKYSKCNKRLNECLLNILKAKMKQEYKIIS